MTKNNKPLELLEEIGDLLARFAFNTFFVLFFITVLVFEVYSIFYLYFLFVYLFKNLFV